MENKLAHIPNKLSSKLLTLALFNVLVEGVSVPRRTTCSSLVCVLVQGCLYEGKPWLQMVSNYQQACQEFLSGSWQCPQKSLVFSHQPHEGPSCYQKSAQD